MHERPTLGGQPPDASPRPRGTRKSRDFTPGIEDEHTGLPALYTKAHIPLSPVPLVAERVGLSADHLAHVIRDGTLPAVKLAGMYFVSLQDAEAYIRSPKNKGGRGHRTPR